MNNKLDRWCESKFIHLYKSACSFKAMVREFNANAPIPTTWLVLGSEESYTRTESWKNAYEKQIKYALRLIKDGYIAVPVSPQRYFTPLEVSLILYAISRKL